MLEGMTHIARSDGVPAGPELGALVAAAERRVANGEIPRDARVLLINTGSWHKYLDAAQTALGDAP